MLHPALTITLIGLLLAVLPRMRVASVELTPASLDLERGDTARIVCTPRNGKGTALTNTCVWALSDSAVLRITAKAAQSVRVTGLKLGKGTVTAWVKRFPKVKGTTAVTISSTDTTTPEPPDTVTPPDTTTPPEPPSGNLSCSTGCRWVSPDGNDANAGTASAPFRSIQKAASVANAGDSILVKPGTYRESVSLSRGGSAGAWVRVICVERHACDMDGQNNALQTAFTLRASYLAVEGFEIKGYQANANVIYSSGTHHFEFLGNWVHTIGRYCFTGTNSRDGISIGNGATDVLFRGNKWGPLIGRLSPSESGGDCYNGDDVWMNHDHGIYVAETDRVTIQQDTFVDFKRGWPIQRYASSGYRVNGLVIKDNYFTGQNPDRYGHIILYSPATGVEIRGNTSDHPNRAFINISQGSYSGVVTGNTTIGGQTVYGGPAGLTISGNTER